MSDTVLVAIITGGVTLTTNLLANWSARKKESVNNAIRDQEIRDKLDVLEKKVDLHNSYGQKFGDVATAMVSMQKDIEYLKKAEERKK